MVRAEPPPRLTTNTRFRRFWAGRFCANTAQNAILLALLVVVVNRTGSTIHSSLLVLSFIVPAAVLGVVGGVVVDHLPRRAVLVLSCLLRALLCLAFLRSSESVWIIYGTNLALSAITQFSGPAESAVVPQLVPAEQIASATAMLNVGIILAQIAGTVVLAPLFVKTVGADPLFVLTTVLFVAGAACYARIPRLARPPEGWMREHAEPRYRGLRASAGESWRLLRSNRSVFLAGVQNTLVTTTIVVLVSVLPNYTRQVLHLPAENAVFVFAPAAIGVAAGNWLVPKLARGRGKSLLGSIGFMLFLLCLTGLGLGDPLVHGLKQNGVFGPAGAAAPGFFYSTAAFSAFMAAPLGFAYAIVLVAARLITYEHVPAHMQGRVFAFQGVLSSLASIVPLLLAGAVSAVFGPRVVLLLVAAANLGALLYARMTLPKGRAARGQAALPIARSQAGQ
ncbi:MAG TPA: MFS transporter [Dehalococcoidia bacterium]|nr:MFS transporter [Dehalococcoidia bacterium]